MKEFFDLIVRLVLDKPAEVAAFVSVIVTFLGVLLAALGLWANYRWNRREYAVRLLENWNVQTSKHRKEVELARPGVIDNPERELIYLSELDAKDIYNSKPDNLKDWDLRFHLIELLNYFELISAAYETKTADRRMIVGSFNKTLIRLYGALNAFIVEVEKVRQYSPWKPYVEVIKKWTRVKYVQMVRMIKKSKSKPEIIIVVIITFDDYTHREIDLKDYFENPGFQKCKYAQKAA